MFPKIDSHSNIPANFEIFNKLPNSKIKLEAQVSLYRSPDINKSS